MADRGWRIVWGALLLFFVFAGCAAPAPAPRLAAGQTADERLLRQSVAAWLGTPHRMGGLGRQGIDCSGLVMTLYDDLYGIRLPRTAQAQMRTGRPVTRQQLAAGDLVFFRPTKKYHHVGIYLGQGEFVHASTSNGVMVSRLDEAFWQDCYLTGRRLLGGKGP